MGQTASLSIQNQSPESDAWELFEVGSNDEVIRIAKENPASHFLNHLAIIASIENGDGIHNPSTKGITPLSPMVEAYINYKNRKKNEAANQLELYYSNKSALICYPFSKFAIDVFFSVKNYSQVLHVVTIYKKKYSDNAFLREEVISLYHNKKYQEVLSVYQSNSKELNDPEIHRVLGLALLFLGKHKEAEKILDNIPGKLNLPSFEEKKKDYDRIIMNFPSYESKKASMTPRELEDLGFAYLFNGDYSKAEKTFLEVTQLLK
ncbi:hypothetical protein [Leptospira sp. GIMC2001]|uniref:hypothetical protein n=1 Tax=Leptospira sp. GIMC2001 TaxID=1513297 RepID=UPI00234A5D53|nr:hypothetical protein [Leptospira sp. GIMC2001]WCL48018.1 hypothetical protein O4O04_11885 [Leptospira sp. GIMC2001]